MINNNQLINEIKSYNRFLNVDKVNKEKFINDDKANSMLTRSQRKPYGVNYIKGL